VIHRLAAMGTLVSIEIDAPQAAVNSAFDWFREVEAACSRFDAGSELRRLPVGRPTQASPILFECLQFALRVAVLTGGAFDPTLGSQLAARGYNRHYRTGEVAEAPGSADTSFRDVTIDARSRTILLERPLTLDLGAVAKGLAVDAAARELQSFGNFCIDAGGDLYCAGHNLRGAPWRIGIRHPRHRHQLLEQVEICDSAVCTSGDYERGEEMVDQRGAAMPAIASIPAVASVTVVGPNAMLADALATAAFVLGAEEGIALLERMDVQGLIVTPALETLRTRNFVHA